MQFAQLPKIGNLIAKYYKLAYDTNQRDTQIEEEFAKQHVNASLNELKNLLEAEVENEDQQQAQCSDKTVVPTNETHVSLKTQALLLVTCAVPNSHILWKNINLDISLNNEKECNLLLLLGNLFPNLNYGLDFG